MKVEKLERLASILCCPDCKSLLKKSSTTEYFCSACSKSFQVRGGVLDFISASNSEISQTSVNRIDNLLKNNILIRVDRGLYMADPDLFGRGKWEDIKEIRTEIIYNGQTGKKEIKSQVFRENLMIASDEDSD